MGRDKLHKSVIKSLPAVASRPHLRTLLIILAAVAAAAGLAVYACFDPSQGGFPECPLHRLTGFDCPGCGTQRAIHAALHGDIVRALRYNASLGVFVPLCAVLCLPPRVRWAKRLRESVWLPRAVLALVLAWWVVRNLI